MKTLANENIIPFVYSFRAQSLGGTGIFTKSSGINTSGFIIKSGDMDGDSDIDLLLFDKIYKNNGNAVFSYYATLNISGLPELADFDNDGDLDILIGLNDSIHFFRNNGSGDFTHTSTFAGGVGTIGDLNGDGFIDMAYFSQMTGEDIFLVKNSQGAFMIDTTNHLDITCYGQTNYYDRISIDDLDNDGDLDLLGINGWFDGNSITFYDLCRKFNKLTNNGSGRFTSQLIFSHSVGHANVSVGGSSDSKTFDTNGDGFVDIASPMVQIKNNGNGTFTNVGTFAFFSNSIEADINGDGDIDLVATASVSPLLLYLNDGVGNYNLFIDNNTLYKRGFASGDFDNDGDIDIAVAEYTVNDEVAILLNGDSPLPAELSSFASSVNSNSVNLSWTTASEENNSGFEIERSKVNDEWSKINFVEGAGNSNTPKNYSYEDKNLSSGKYKYRLKQLDFNGNFKYYELQNEVSIGIPGKFELLQNFPNPFNPSTKINYSIPSDGIVTLKIYDINGKVVQTIMNEFKNAGYYSAEFNGSSFASGVYYYRMEVLNTPPTLSQEGSFVQTKKMLLIK